ncbi:MAG: type IX secretion system outer membrane channel protein PorV [Parafilimonas sp.]|nr:type IX secretion system outer membrane channel protein PorV [Parafilimonas sp.]
MKRQKLLVLILTATCSIFLLTANIQAQTGSINIVTTAVPFLRISPDARAGGMGDAGIAISPDAYAQFWNIGKIPFSSTPDAIGVTYTPWLHDIAQDVYMISMAGYHKLGEDQAFSAGIRYFNLGQIQFTDAFGNPLNTGRPHEFGLDLGYSRKISNALGIGVALRYINSALANGVATNGVTYKAGNTIAADISLYGDNTNEDDGSGLTYGLSITDLGGKIGYTDNADTKDYIPANMGAGLAYTWAFQEEHKFTLALDVNKLLVPSFPQSTGDSATDAQAINDYHTQSVFSSWGKSFGDNTFSASVGAEYTYNNQFSLRAGYYKETKQMGDRSYFTAGVGMKYQIFTFNFSYLAPSGNGVTRNPLSNTLRFGVLFDLAPQQ